MPILDIGEGRDTILAHFKAGWDAQTPPVPTVFYDDVRGSDDTDSDLSSLPSEYARIFVQHFDFPQTTLSGEDGASRFRRFGLITIQVFTPYGRGYTRSDALVNIAERIFQGKSTGGDSVEFRNVRSNEIGQSGRWAQVNVLIDFTYDSLR